MITCRVYQKIILSSVDADTALPRRTRKHVQNCPDCRDVYESQTGIARQLRADAGIARQEPSPFLHARIMSSLAHSQINAERKHERIWFGWASALTMVCFLLAGVIWFRNQPAPDGLDGFQRPLASAPASPELTAALELPDGTQMRQWTVKLDEPLQTEMNLVVDNTKTAANALVNNFMPEKLRNSLFEEALN
jgi:hypothetical protein